MRRAAGNATRRAGRPRRRRTRLQPPARRQADVRNLRLRDARHRATTSSRSTRTGSTSCGRPSCRRSTTSSARTAAVRRRAPEPLRRRRATTPTDARRAEDDLRVRAVRHRRRRRARRRSACATRTASWGSFGAGQTWSPFMDPDVFPNSIEYWGPTAWCSSATSSSAGCRSTAIREPDVRARAAGRERATRASYADRIELQNVKGALPAARLSRARTTPRRTWGYVQVAGILSARSSGTTSSTDQFDLSGSATGWGINLSSNSSSTSDTLRLPVRLRRRHRELHERRAGRRRRRAESREPGHADQWRRRCRSWGSSLFVDHTWSEHVHELGRLLDASTSTTPTDRRPTPSRTATTRSSNLLCTPGQERHGRRRVAVGPPRELQRRLHVRRLPCSSRSNTTSGTSLGG